jgi:hypothetical protein
MVTTYLPVIILAGSIGTIAAIVVGLNQALKRANWSERERRLAVGTTSAVLVGWFAAAVALASLGVYRANAHQLPAIQFGILIPILVGSIVIWRSTAFSRLLEAVPQRWIVAIQAYRLEGATFLILYAAGQLPGLFALPAGIGDMTTGLLALVIGLNASRRQQIPSRNILLWNLFGIADLIVAVTTGFLTSPSPLQQFAFDHPNELISQFPLILIPTFLVPLAVLLHIVSLTKLGHANTRVDTGFGHAHEALGKLG